MYRPIFAYPVIQNGETTHSGWPKWFLRGEEGSCGWGGGGKNLGQCKQEIAISRQTFFPMKKWCMIYNLSRMICLPCFSVLHVFFHNLPDSSPPLSPLQQIRLCLCYSILILLNKYPV